MKSSKWLIVVLVLGIALTGGCKNDQPYQAKRIDLGAAAPEPIIGWSTTLGRLVQEQCYTYDLVNGGDFNTDTSFSVAQTSSQESHNFGVDTSVSAKVKLFSGSDSFSYVNNSNESALSVAMWFNADSSGTLKIQNVHLNATGLEAALKGGAYFGLMCGDKVITNFPVMLSTRFNINFQSASYSDATDISNSVKASYSFVQVSNQIKDDFSKSSSNRSLQIQYATVGNPDLFDPSYISKADEASCYSGDCSDYAADLIKQFAKAAQLAGQQLAQDIDNFNTIYYINYPQLLSDPGNFMEASTVFGVPGDTSDPYADHKDIIDNAVNVYADLLLAAQAMNYISSNSSIFGADSQTLLAVNDYQAILNGYATTLFSQIDSCFDDPTKCSAIAADTSIFNIIAADTTLDSATQDALKSTVQALIYDVSTQTIADLYFNGSFYETVWNNYFPQKLVYLTTFGPDSNGVNYDTVAATLNTIGAFTQNMSAGGAIFPLTALSFDENTLLPSAGTFPSTTYQYINTAVYQNNSAGRANGTDSYQFLIPPPRAIDFSLMYQLGAVPIAYYEYSLQLSFVPRLDYLPTINPFYQSAAQQGVYGALLK